VAGLASSGTVTSASSVYATSFVTASDAALKANLAPLAARAGDLFALRGLSFHYKRRPDGTVAADGVPDLNRTHFGFLAQDVEGPFPELVGRSHATGLRDVAYQAFVPLLVEGLKGHRRELSALRTQVTAGDDSQLKAIAGLTLRLDALLSASAAASSLAVTSLALSPPAASRAGFGGLLMSGAAGAATASARTIRVEGLTAAGAVSAQRDLVLDMAIGAAAAALSAEVQPQEVLDEGRAGGPFFSGQMDSNEQASLHPKHDQLAELVAEVARLGHRLEAAEAKLADQGAAFTRRIEALEAAARPAWAAGPRETRTAGATAAAEAGAEGTAARDLSMLELSEVPTLTAAERGGVVSKFDPSRGASSRRDTMDDAERGAAETVNGVLRRAQS
jgi:hypothetical protein